MPALVLVFPIVAAFRSRYFREVSARVPARVHWRMCYTIYLLHYPLMHVIGEYTRELVVTSSLTVNLRAHAVGFPFSR